MEDVFSEAASDATSKLTCREIALARMAEAIRVLGECADAAYEHLDVRERAYLEMVDHAGDEFHRSVLTLAGVA